LGWTAPNLSLASGKARPSAARHDRLLMELSIAFASDAAVADPRDSEHTIHRG